MLMAQPLTSRVVSRWRMVRERFNGLSCRNCFPRQILLPKESYGIIPVSDAVAEFQGFLSDSFSLKIQCHLAPHTSARRLHRSVVLVSSLSRFTPIPYPCGYAV